MSDDITHEEWMRALNAPAEAACRRVVDAYPKGTDMRVLVGAVMKELGGKANPKHVAEVLRGLVDGEAKP